jgi:2-keto-4-pentenoate hydratase
LVKGSDAMGMMRDATETARRIAAARLAGERLGQLPDGERPNDAAAGYLVQDAAHEILSAAGFGPVIGHKIGCTTRVMQSYLGIPHPCSGGVFAASVHHGTALIPHSSFRRVGVECEIAVSLSRDLGPRDNPFTATEVGRAVDFCMAAIEIVDDRYVDWRQLDAPTLIADDFFGAGCVLGTATPGGDWPDLAGVSGTTRINGIEAGTGRGADVMGHPLEALAWLANSMAGRGRPLRRGEFVLTGSLVETRWPEPGDTVVVEISGLGTATASFP